MMVSGCKDYPAAIAQQRAMSVVEFDDGAMIDARFCFSHLSSSAVVHGRQ
jgi:hypothetical protein